MSRSLDRSTQFVVSKVEELRRRPGIFSFQTERSTVGRSPRTAPAADLGISPGSVVELLTTRPGSGAFTAVLALLARASGDGAWVVIDPSGDCYFPAWPGWGIDPGRLLVVRPPAGRECWWAIEQCLRSTAVATTWAWLDGQIPDRVYRRWQLAAEKGGGVGLFFRPVDARRAAAWADLRLLVTPLVGANDDSRRIQIDELYRRGGKGGRSLVWGVDHGAGDVHLVPQVANPARLERKA